MALNTTLTIFVKNLREQSIIVNSYCVGAQKLNFPTLYADNETETK